MEKLLPFSFQYCVKIDGFAFKHLRLARAFFYFIFWRDKERKYLLAQEGREEGRQPSPACMRQKHWSAATAAAAAVGGSTATAPYSDSSHFHPAPRPIQTHSSASTLMGPARERQRVQGGLILYWWPRGVERVHGRHAICYAWR